MILLTGGAGYIGSHIAVALLDAGLDVVVVDNLCNSNSASLERVRAVCGRSIVFRHVGAPFTFSDLSKHLGGDQPFYALQPSGFDGQSEPMDRVEDIAEYFARQIVEYQPTGPYIIVGYCSGAPTAFELAKILEQRGAEIP